MHSPVASSRRASSFVRAHTHESSGGLRTSSCQSFTRLNATRARWPRGLYGAATAWYAPKLGRWRHHVPSGARIVPIESGTIIPNPATVFSMS